MPTRRVFVLLAASTLLCALTVYGQDSQSLGDVARRTRQQKQQKDAQPAKPLHVITNDEIPSHVGPTVTSARGPQTDAERGDLPNSGDRDARAEQLRSRIEAQKRAIARLEAEVAHLTESIHYAGRNCVANCVQRNERQREKQDQAESMRAQVEEQKKQLERMQESARKQGFGSSVYEP